MNSALKSLFKRASNLPSRQKSNSKPKIESTFLQFTRRYHPSSFLKYQEKIVSKNSKGEDVIEIRGRRSTEYHRTSTRYSNTTPELLNALREADFSLMPHKMPEGPMDKIANFIIQRLREITDWYFKDDLLKRAMMLETVAAVPGMVAGMLHHLNSLRNLKSNNWIKTLLDEAENERMHLMTFMKIIKPKLSERLLIVLVQGIFFAGYLGAYVLFPKTCHRFTGYLEEEAVKTYTHFLKLIDEGKIANIPAPQIALEYWNMPPESKLRDVVVIIRADEMDHRDVNHTMADYIGQLRKKDIVFNEISIDHHDLYSMEIAHGKKSVSVEELVAKSGQKE